MSVRVSDLQARIERIAPSETAQEWDNVGLQIGSPEMPLSGVLVCLDINDAVIDEALEVGANLIVAHHPMIFRPLTAVRTDRPVGSLIRRMLKQEIAAFVAHTNLDAAPELGTAAVLADLLDIECERPLLEMGEVGLGCVGNSGAGLSLEDLVERVRERLQPARIAVVGASGAPVRRIALMPGSGGDAVGAAISAGADVLVCGDLKHHDALDALANGLTVIDATHYATERPVVERLARHLATELQGEIEVVVSAVLTDPFAGAFK